MRTFCIPWCLALVLMTGLFMPGWSLSANDPDDEANGIRITNQVTLGIALEFDWIRETEQGNRERARNGTIDLELEVEWADGLEAGLGFSHDISDDTSSLDFWKLAWQGDVFGVSAGLQELPFTRSDSDFISDSVTEFAAIDAESVLFSAMTLNSLAVNVGVFRPASHGAGYSSSNVGWLAGIAYRPNDDTVFGLRYLRDLNHADNELFENVDHPQLRRIPALAMDARLSVSDWELSIGSVFALRHVTSDAGDQQKPFTLSAEARRELLPDVDIGFRFEQSRDLDEFARQRFGLSALWQFHPKVRLSAEYLISRYVDKAGDDAQKADNANALGLQLRIEF